MCLERPVPIPIRLLWLACLGLALLAARRGAAEDLVQAMPLSVARVVDQSLGADGELPELVVEPAGGELPVAADSPSATEGFWTWQILPEGILYPSYLAGPSEPRFASQWIFEDHKGWLWDIALGGRAGIFRYGTTNPAWPEGYQLDIEGAAFPRLALEENCDLASADFRFGVPLTYRQGPWESKFGYYHLSSHLGDEFMLHHEGWERINYSRDALLAGLALRPNRDWRLYAETAWAFYTAGGAEPWEFQMGVSYSPAEPTGFQGAPFAAVHGQLRQENDFGGNVTLQAGWAWRGPTAHLFRIGLHYLNGKSNQRQFFRQFEQQIGVGLWYDF